jgi:uncharacterized protein (UPF0548 family)
MSSSDSLTYPEVGATAGELPAGYAHLRRTKVIGSGPEAFTAVSEALLTWDIHRRAGLQVDASTPRAAAGVEVRLGLGVGALRLVAPCRVVDVVAESARCGFAYGTLQGHPEAGEERFLVTLGDDGLVRAEIVAFSRPARWFTRVSGPGGRLAQGLVTRRYLRAYASFAR